MAAYRNVDGVPLGLTARTLSMRRASPEGQRQSANDHVSSTIAKPWFSIWCTTGSRCTPRSEAHRSI